MLELLAAVALGGIMLIAAVTYVAICGVVYSIVFHTISSIINKRAERED